MLICNVFAFAKRGCWLDVKMKNCAVAAMEEGVRRSAAFIAVVFVIVVGSVIVVIVVFVVGFLVVIIVVVIVVVITLSPLLFDLTFQPRGIVRL